MVELNQIINNDCMLVMKDISDKYFELAIVDPPYGIGESKKQRVNTPCKRWKSARNDIPYIPKQWDSEIPNKLFFDELFRVSQNQIIFGGNYMTDYLRPSMGWVFWDKKNGDTDFSDGELAWTSFNKGLRKFEYLWSGFKKQKPEIRHHPTQKPVALYKWLLHNYAKQGDKILDTHSGSGTTAVACIDMGFEYLCIEKDKDYFDASVKRINKELLKIKMF